MKSPTKSLPKPARKQRAAVGSEDKRTPDEWLALPEYAGVVILDPDGWDRHPDRWEASWGERITKDEFEGRTVQSTCQFPAGFFDKYRPAPAAGKTGKEGA